MSTLLPLTKSQNSCSCIRIEDQINDAYIIKFKPLSPISNGQCIYDRQIQYRLYHSILQALGHRLRLILDPNGLFF